MNSRLQEVHVSQVRSKIGSKKELYDFLTQEIGAYLPKLNCTNIYFFRSILTGEKEFLKRSDVIVSAVPQIEGLTADDFLQYAENKQSILKYLPDQIDWLHLDKKWITDVILSLDTDGVNEMINKAKEQRRIRLDSTQNNIVHMKPEFIDALNNSISFSVNKGRSAFLLKKSTKRKSRQISDEEEKINSISGTKSKTKIIEQNKRVREEINDMRAQIDDLLNYKQLVMQLHDGGIIDQEGNLTQSAPIQQNNNFMI